MEQEEEQSGQENRKLSLAVEQDAVEKAPAVFQLQCSELPEHYGSWMGGTGAWDYMKS